MRAERVATRHGGGRGFRGYGVLLPLLLLATATTACTPQAPPVGETAPITQEQERATGASYPKAVEDEAVAEMVHAMDEALTAGDVDAFLEHVSPELHEEQRSWFEAVASVPMDVRGLRADRIASRRSPEGTVVHVGLRHRIQGGDPEPVMQQYRWTVAPGEDGRPLLVEATGRNGQFFGNPAPWDLGPVAALEGDGVLVLAPEDARSEAEFLLPGLEAAAREVLEDFPTLAEDRQVLVVHLVTADVLADALDVDEDEGWTAGLARLGVDRVVIACNTLHAFLPPAADLPVPVLSLIEVGAEAVVAAGRRVAGDGGRRPVVTLLATDGTLLSGVYQEALARLGAEVRLPDEAAQRQVMAMIYERVKAGVEVTTEEFEEFVDRQRAATGADAVLLGCTELSVLAEQVVQQHHDLPDHVVDAQMALVTRVVADLGPRSQA